ncbi:hypothetical protein DFP72DRAFT_930169 [Ephemerocybe angulata]|uniref:Secreted protein n=1 Tax=Ephemerocybe angulata TaxID=980116 RepID=A0A8H6LVV0_9AGAR|nr:hypothetical protein DFP72DRAFT_930169 [Tulosesus angulatus]
MVLLTCLALWLSTSSCPSRYSSKPSNTADGAAEWSVILASECLLYRAEQARCRWRAEGDILLQAHCTTPGDHVPLFGSGSPLLISLSYLNSSSVSSFPFYPYHLSRPCQAT